MRLGVPCVFPTGLCASRFIRHENIPLVGKVSNNRNVLMRKPWFPGILCPNDSLVTVNGWKQSERQLTMGWIKVFLIGEKPSMKEQLSDL